MTDQIETIDWPRLLAPRTPGFQQRGMSILGPVTITGRSQAGSIDAGYWVANFIGVSVGGPTKVKLFRQVRALLEGSSKYVRVPVYDEAQIPYGTVDASADTPFENDAGAVDGTDVYFEDDTGFASDPIAAFADEAAEVGATRLVVDFQNAGTIEGGEYFSIGDRLYVIKSILSTDGTTLDLAIWPRLREAVEIGAHINFSFPVCKMRLMSDQEMDLDLDIGRVGNTTVMFVEVF